MPDRTVYSSERGRINTCPTCGQPYKHCRCDQPSTPVKKSDGIVRVMRDRKQPYGQGYQPSSQPGQEQPYYQPPQPYGQEQPYYRPEEQVSDHSPWTNPGASRRS